MEALKDTAFINALLLLVGIVFAIGVGVVLLYQHFQKNLFIHKLKQEALKNEYQNDLLRSNIRSQEEERKRIAHDLHDELGAVLSIMRMNIVLLEQQETVQGRLLAGLQNIRSLSETAIANIRAISHRLMPPQLEAFGLIKTLESLVEQINATGNIKIELLASVSLQDAPWPVNLGLYRIIMELVHNTIKHAEANMAKIDISLQAQVIHCTYQDDGKGLLKHHEHNGLGHAGIEARVNSLNGIFEMRNNTLGGFYACIKIPVGENIS